MFAQRLRVWYPGIPITETHPKALLKGVMGSDLRSLPRRPRTKSVRMFISDPGEAAPPP
jgi:hypothetical protein